PAPDDPNTSQMLSVSSCEYPRYALVVVVVVMLGCDPVEVFRDVDQDGEFLSEFVELVQLLVTLQDLFLEGPEGLVPVSLVSLGELFEVRVGLAVQLHVRREDGQIGRAHV